MPNNRRVIDLIDGTIYNSQLAASQAAGVNKSTMSKHLSGKSATAGGRLYALYDADAAPTAEELAAMRLRALERIHGIDSNNEEGTP